MPPRREDRFDESYNVHMPARQNAAQFRQRQRRRQQRCFRPRRRAVY